MLPTQAIGCVRSSVNTGRNGNIYEFDAASALQRYAPFADGRPDGTLAVIFHETLSPDARAALASSAERLGFGRDGIIWISCTGLGGEDALSASELLDLAVSCDPIAFACTDATAAHLLGGAFETPCAIGAHGRVAGRNLVAFERFNDMLASPEEKQRAWALLKRLA